MKITKRQLRHIIKEAIDPREMEEPLGGWAGNALTNDPDYPHPDDTDTLKVADLVRSVDYRGDGRGGDFERVVGDQIGTVVEVDKDIDGTQYTVFFPDGTTIMDTADSFEIVNENKITKRQLRRIIREAIEGPDGVWYDDYGNPLQPDDLQRLEDENAYVPMKSFKIPYKNYGYEGRKIIDRDRAWLEFVPKGSPSMTQEDMFRAVTLLDSDDQEIGLAMATTHAPKFDRRHLENYDVYSVYATTTG